MGFRLIPTQRRTDSGGATPRTPLLPLAMVRPAWVRRARGSPLVAAVAAVALAVALVSAFTYYSAGAFNRRAADTRASNEAASFASHSATLATGDAFAGYIQILRDAEDPIVRNKTAAQDERVRALQGLLFLNLNRFDSLTIAERGGLVLATTDASLVSVRDSAAFAETRANLSPANSDVILSQSGRRGYVEYTSALREPDGTTWGVLVARADPSRLWTATLLAAVDGSRNVIINNAGLFAAGVPDELVGQPWKGSTLGPNGVRATIDGVDSICGLAPIGKDTQIDRGLNVASCLPTSVIQAEHGQAMGKQALVTLASAVLAIGLAAGLVKLGLGSVRAPARLPDPDEDLAARATGRLAGLADPAGDDDDPLLSLITGARRDQLDQVYLGEAGGEAVRPSASATSTTDAGGNAVTSSIEGAPGRGPQAPPAIDSTMGTEPSGSTTRKIVPEGDLRGGTSSENIAASVGPPERAFNPDPEQLAHLHNLVDHGDWTETPGARVGARAVINMLLKGEEPSPKQMAMLMRAMESKQATAPVAAAGGFNGSPPMEPPTATSGTPPDSGPRAAAPSDAGAMQLALADTATDAYVGAVSVSKTPEVTSRFTRFLQAGLSPLQLIKTVKTSFDIGWGGRQGWRLLPRNPVEWWQMYGKQFKAFRSEENYNAIMADAKSFPNFERSQDPKYERNLAFLERGTGSPETSGEEFTSPWTQHLDEAPGPLGRVGAAVVGSERAYVAPGNWMRQAVLDKWVDRAVKRTGAPVSDADFQLYMDHVNNATLRGSIGKLKESATADALSSLLFSTRGQVSGPQFVADLLRVAVNGGDRYSPEARRIIAENVGAYIGMGMGALGLAATTGYALDKAGKPSYVNVDLNDLSSTFGQMSIGPVRWNYWGADQSLVRTLIQMSRGKAQTPGLPARDVDRRRLVSNFIGNKIAPGGPKLAWDELVNQGRTQNSGIFNNDTGVKGMNINTPMGALIYAFNQTAPISLESTVQSWQQAGPIAAPFTFVAETHGLSTSTYQQPYKILADARDAAAKSDGYHDFADAQKQLGGPAAASKYAGDPKVAQAQAVLDQNPSPFRDAMAETQKQQEALDASLTAGAMSPSQWRDQRKQLQANQAGRLALLKQQGGDKPTGDDVLDGYYRVFADNSDPKTGFVADQTALSDALDQYQAKLSPEAQAHLDANTGLSHTTPKVQEYRQAVKEIAASGYFDVSKDIWKEMQQDGSVPSEAASAAAMRQQVTQEIRDDVMKEDPSTPDVLVQAITEAALSQIPALKVFDAVSAAARNALISSDPKVAALLVKWFGRSARQTLKLNPGVLATAP